MSRVCSPMPSRSGACRSRAAGDGVSSTTSSSSSSSGDNVVDVLAAVAAHPVATPASASARTRRTRTALVLAARRLIDWIRAVDASGSVDPVGSIGPIDERDECVSMSRGCMTPPSERSVGTRSLWTRCRGLADCELGGGVATTQAGLTVTPLWPVHAALEPSVSPCYPSIHLSIVSIIDGRTQPA